MKKMVRFQYNSPVALTFALLSFAALMLEKYLGGTNSLLFSVYHSSLSDLLTYPRFILHVLGHPDYRSFISNIMMILLLCPTLEQRYGSGNIFGGILVTALVSGLIHWLFFPGVLMGASAVVFMLIIMASLAGMRSGYIPITFILVLVLYISGEIVSGVPIGDNTALLTRIAGGTAGAVIGMRR